MDRLLEDTPTTDPLAVPEQRAVIDQVLEANRDTLGAAMLVLNELQTKIGYISAPMQVYIAEQLKLPPGVIHGVVTFYSFFNTQPRGRHIIKFCMGTACYVGGMPQLIEKAKQALGIELGDTTPDGAITLEVCRCVGACSQAPVLVVDDEAQGRIKPNKVPQIVRKLQG